MAKKDKENEGKKKQRAEAYIPNDDTNASGLSSIGSSQNVLGYGPVGGVDISDLVHKAVAQPAGAAVAPTVTGNGSSATNATVGGTKGITPIQTPASVTAPAMANPVAQEAHKRYGPKTFNELLAINLENARKAALKEKTDAAKMQQYYALADAFNAIGKLGGSAIGGAIGGNAADSAPAVDPYKESRGYLEAFEKAKKANDRLRELDDRDFNLALRGEEREYNKALRDADNAMKLQLAEMERAWQKEFFDYRTRIDQAVAQGNMELKAKLDAEVATKAQEYALERMRVQHGYDMKAQDKRADIVRMQMGLGKDGGAVIKTKPFTFNNNTKVDIPEKLYPDMLSYFAAKGNIGDEPVDADNVEDVLRNHPELVNSYLLIHGYGTQPQEITNEHMPDGTYVQPKATGYLSGEELEAYVDKFRQ